MLRTVFGLLMSLIAGSQVIAGPLHEASNAGDVGALQAALETDPDIDSQDNSGETPLNLAIVHGHDDVAIMLLEAGASVDARNRGGFTPLHSAAYADRPAVAAALIERGANIEDQGNKAGVTPLSVAAEEGNADVAAVLIENGAEVDVTERNGYTPLSRALWRNRDRVVALLQAAGAVCQPEEILGEPTYAKCMAGQK